MNRMMRSTIDMFGDPSYVHVVDEKVVVLLGCNPTISPFDVGPQWSRCLLYDLVHYPVIFSKIEACGDESGGIIDA